MRSDLPIVASRQPYTCISVLRMNSHAHKDRFDRVLVLGAEGFHRHPVPVNKTILIAQVARTNSAEKVSSAAVVVGGLK